MTEFFCWMVWWEFTDLNRGPTGYEPVALTNCAKLPNTLNLAILPQIVNVICFDK